MSSIIAGAALRRLLNARDLVHARLEEGVALARLADEAGLSRAHFCRSFRRAFGVSPHEYLVQLRMHQAQNLLAKGASVTEACFGVGFSSLGTFSRVFAARYGESPRAWQRRVRVTLPSAELWPAVWIPGCYLMAYGGWDAH
jgi:AraC-like DNA-binding protein